MEDYILNVMHEKGMDAFFNHMDTSEDPKQVAAYYLNLRELTYSSTISSQEAATSGRSAQNDFQIKSVAFYCHCSGLGSSGVGLSA